MCFCIVSLAVRRHNLMDAKLKQTQLGVALWLAAYIVALVAH